MVLGIDWEREHDKEQSRADAAERERDEARARVAELEGALRPFTNADEPEQISSDEILRARTLIANRSLADSYDIDRIRAQVIGWKRTALAMRDEAIYWNQEGKSRLEVIERMYFDAALLDKFQPENSRPPATENAGEPANPAGMQNDAWLDEHLAKAPR